MSKDLFNDLDSLIFSEQPSEINVSDFKTEETEETAEDIIIPIEAESKESTSKKESTEKKETDFIDPNDFFNRIKEDKEELDEEEEEPKNSKKEIESNDEEKNSPEEQLKVWGDYFKTNNVLSEEDLEDFDGSEEGLTKAFEKREIRVGLEMVDDYKAQLPPLLKHLAENWEEGVPLDQLVNIKSNQIRYSSIDDKSIDNEDKESLRKDIMTMYLKETTKLSDIKISKLVQQKIDLGEDIEEAKENLAELKTIESQKEEILKKETKINQERTKAEHIQTIKSYEKLVSETKEFIPGIKITEKQQKDILNKIINPIGVDNNGNSVSYVSQLRSEDPKKFDANLIYLLTLTDGFKDWSKINIASTTQATKNLAKILETGAPKSSKTTIKTEKKSSLLDILEYNNKYK